MKTKQIREMETDHIGHELADKQKHLYELRTQAVTEKLENPSQLRKTRRDIAQLKTILRQRQIATAATAVAAPQVVAATEEKAGS
jgi:large subunit ribosomal protein L29